jgi:hypothetical protein
MAQIQAYSIWIQVEHNRLHVVEGWPESLHKAKMLSAIHATLASLSSQPLAKSLPLTCDICLERKRRASVAEFPLLLRVAGLEASLAD